MNYRPDLYERRGDLDARAAAQMSHHHPSKLRYKEATQTLTPPCC